MHVLLCVKSKHLFFLTQDIGYSPSCDFISSRLVNFVVTVVNNFEEPQFLQGKDKVKEPTVSLASMRVVNFQFRPKSFQRRDIFAGG